MVAASEIGARVLLWLDNLLCHQVHYLTNYSFPNLLFKLNHALTIILRNDWHFQFLGEYRNFWIAIFIEIDFFTVRIILP